MWTNTGMLVWGLPLAIFGGLVASRAIHSQTGKSLIRTGVHGALYYAILRPLFRGR